MHWHKAAPRIRPAAQALSVRLLIVQRVAVPPRVSVLPSRNVQLLRALKTLVVQPELTARVVPVLRAITALRGHIALLALGAQIAMRVPMVVIAQMAQGVLRGLPVLSA